MKTSRWPSSVNWRISRRHPGGKQGERHVGGSCCGQQAHGLIGPCELAPCLHRGDVVSSCSSRLIPEAAQVDVPAVPVDGGHPPVLVPGNALEPAAELLPV